MSTLSYTLTHPQRFVSDSQTALNVSKTSTGSTRVMEMMKSVYQAEQQAKFLHLQAEVDSLLQQLQTLKQQRQASADEAATGKNMREQRH